MKKRLIGAALAVLMTTTILAGCGSSDSNKTAGGNGDNNLKVGMTTDAGTIDDKSFNQGTWEGIELAGKDLGVETKYIQPKGETEAEYLPAIANLYDTGHRMIVMPGFKFETAAYKAQEKYKDSKFVIIDGAPKETSESTEAKVADNTVAIFYAEEQSGFIAGVATALEIKEGDLGFIGGLEIPAVQKFNWGFQQGVKYANENLGTNTTLKAENVQYAESFNDVAKGQQMASTMYGRGVKAIFASAGKVGVGVINEAKTRVSKGETAWVVGVDVDQYADGEYEAGKSVVLTSAMKKLGKSVYDMIDADLKGQFPGGQTLTFDVKNDGVGIPDENPNLSDETTAKVKEIYEKVKSGEIQVSAEKGDLLK